MLPAVEKCSCCFRSKPADGAQKLIAAYLGSDGALSVHLFFFFVLYRMVITHIS